MLDSRQASSLQQFEKQSSRYGRAHILADTPEENRKQVLEMVEQAPEVARRALGLTLEENRIVWWWPRLSLLAQKPVS